MIDTLISYLPSGLTLFTSSSFFLVGLGLLIYQYFRLVPYRLAALAVGTGLIASAMYLGGAGNQKAIQEYQTLQNQLIAAKEALKLSESLLKIQQQDNDQSVKDKEVLEDLDKRIKDAKDKTSTDVCFGPDDVKRLRTLFEQPSGSKSSKD